MTKRKAVQALLESPLYLRFDTATRLEMVNYYLKEVEK